MGSQGLPFCFGHLGWDMSNLKRALAGLCTTTLALASVRAAEPTSLTEPGARTGPWEKAFGEGFASTAQSLTLQSGAIQGVAILGTRQAHDLGLLSLSYGHMLGRTVGEDHFYKGNWEFRAELFGGEQFSPNRDWVLGIAPHLRYNFATGTRWVPFVDAGAGATATSIGPPDLSNTFEFNLQATVGTHLFLWQNLALTLEARYVHLSCAGISNPNRGLNGAGGMIGLTWFF
jgi:hypothetical protein